MATKKSPPKKGETLEEERPQCNDPAKDEKNARENAATISPITCGCEDTKAEVVSCYEQYPTESMECKKPVEEFESCVKVQIKDCLLNKSKNEEK